MILLAVTGDNLPKRATRAAGRRAFRFMNGAFSRAERSKSPQRPPRYPLGPFASLSQTVNNNTAHT